MNNKSSRKQFNSLLKRAEYNEEKGEIRVAGADWILMSSATFRRLVEGTERILRSAAAVIWLEAGKHAGKEFAGSLLSKGMKTEELPHVLEVFFTQGGWGKIQTKIDFTKREALVTIRNSATARQTESKEPVCHFIRGFISGVSDVLLDGLTECLETKCLAKGDALCEFRVKIR